MIPPKVADMSRLVVSPMPGVVVSVNVKVGDVVVEGGEVAVVEAMKMQNVLRASAAGRVKKVSVKSGGSVKTSDVLIELEPVTSAG